MAIWRLTTFFRYGKHHFSKLLNKNRSNDFMLDNPSCTFEGIVTKSYSSKGNNNSYFISGNGTIFLVLSKEYLEIGTTAKVTGRIEPAQSKETIILAEKIELLPSAKTAEIFNSAESAISGSIALNNVDLLVNDEITKTLELEITKIAKKILTAQKLNRFILLRFHNDADGISGALALTNFIRCKSMQQNSASYGVGDAINDLNFLGSEWKPVLILLDFGSNQESIEGLSLVKAAGVEVVIIDHHPPAEKINDIGLTVLNPWLLVLGSNLDDYDLKITKFSKLLNKNRSNDLSKYTAGYITCEVARKMARDNNFDSQLIMLAKIAVAGDKSKILELTQKEKDAALVLDYIAAYSRYGNTLDFYRLVLKNDDLFNSMLMQANEKIAEMREIAKRTMKETKIGELTICVLDLETLDKKDVASFKTFERTCSNDFPSRGKVTTNIFESLPQDKPLLVIGYSARSIILRLNELAEQAGFSGHEIVERVKISMKDFIESGGGHRKAAAIRVKSGFGKDVVEEILRILGAEVN